MEIDAFVRKYYFFLKCKSILFIENDEYFLIEKTKLQEKFRNIENSQIFSLHEKINDCEDLLKEVNLIIDNF